MVAQMARPAAQDENKLSSSEHEKHDAFGPIHCPSDTEFREIETALETFTRAFARIASGQELDVREANSLAHRAAKEKNTAQLARRWNTWNRQLSRNKSLSATAKELTRALVYRVERAQTPDDAGRWRVNIGQFAEDTGVSTDTVTRNFIDQLIPSGIIASHYTPKERNENGKLGPRWYVLPGQEVLSRPESIMLPTPSNHGGKPGRSLPCAKCGREDTKIKTVKRVAKFVICPCGHKSRLEKPTVTITFEDPTTGEKTSSFEHEKHDAFGDLAGQIAQPTPENASITPLPDESNMRPILKPSTPPQVAPQVASEITTPQASGQDIMQAAAQLLVDIAGDDSDHVEMIRDLNKKKYLPARPRRKLQLEDALNHLQGKGGARGALCAYASGQARMLTFETDKQEEWPDLQAIAIELYEGGYKVILEPSPAARGGKLYIIYDELVYVEAARRSLYDASDALKELAQRPGAEYWPRGGYRVRLPGAFYTRGPINEFCEVQAIASDTRASTDRQAVAQILLENQTPGAIVSPRYIEEETARQVATVGESGGGSRRQLRRSGVSEASGTDTECRPEQVVGGNAGQEVDARHKEKYRAPLHFQWDKGYLIRRFNASHTLEEILPLEANGMALSPLHSERTASVGYWKDGTLFTDFSQGARYTGDAFELEALVHYGGNKGDLARSLANDLIRDARLTLDSCAASGQALPGWVQEILAPAGQALYDRQYVAPAARQVLEKEENDGQAHPVAATTTTAQENGHGGVLGFNPCPITARPQIKSLDDLNREIMTTLDGQYKASLVAIEQQKDFLVWEKQGLTAREYARQVASMLEKDETSAALAAIRKTIAYANDRGLLGVVQK